MCSAAGVNTGSFSRQINRSHHVHACTNTCRTRRNKSSRSCCCLKLTYVKQKAGNSVIPAGFMWEWKTNGMIRVLQRGGHFRGLLTKVIQKFESGQSCPTVVMHSYRSLHWDGSSMRTMVVHAQNWSFLPCYGAKSGCSLSVAQAILSSDDLSAVRQQDDGGRA